MRARGYLAADGGASGLLTPFQKPVECAARDSGIGSFGIADDASFVNINFKKVDSLFIATLEDDGRGIDVNRNNEGKGISKMISLANKMGGEYKIENLLPNGTKIWVKVPIEEHFNV